MIEQYINGKLTPGDMAKADQIQKRHIAYSFKRPLTKSDSLRLDSIKRVTQIKDSLKQVKEKQMIEEIKKAKEEKAKLDAEKQEKKKPQMPNDPIIRPETDESVIKEKGDDHKKDKKPTDEEKK